MKPLLFRKWTFDPRHIVAISPLARSPKFCFKVSTDGGEFYFEETNSADRMPFEGQYEAFLKAWIDSFGEG